MREWRARRAGRYYVIDAQFIPEQRIAESFVNTVKRDYVSMMDRSTAEAVLAQLPGAFTHFNEVHSHPSLNLQLPRMYRRELPRRAQESGADQATGCVRLYGGKITDYS